MMALLLMPPLAGCYRRHAAIVPCQLRYASYLSIRHDAIAVTLIWLRAAYAMITLFVAAADMPRQPLSYAACFRRRRATLR